MDFVFLDVPKMPDKSRRFLWSLYRAAKSMGADCAVSKTYMPCKGLVIYGLGGQDRYPVGMAHIKRGLPLLSFDLGYWDRKLPQRKYRFSLNGMHPAMVMDTRYPGPSRWLQSGLKIKSVIVDPAAPILLVGNAPKSIAVGAKNWTADKAREIRRAFPKHKILYRPKPKRPHEPGVIHDGVSAEPIDYALRNASLVVCRHSNVAVDAARQGVPVVCDDGAAAAIYPQALADYRHQPTLEVRREFLHRLAWWQWANNEAPAFWQWFFATFPDYDYRAKR